MLRPMCVSMAYVSVIVMGLSTAMSAESPANTPPAAEPMKPVATTPAEAPAVATAKAAPAAAPAATKTTPSPAKAPEQTEQASARPVGPDLEDLMHEMENHYQALKMQVAKPEYKADSLERIVLFQRLSLLAKPMTPPVIHRIAADELPAKLAAYRKTMNQLIHRLSDLEAALLEGRFEDAPALLKKVHDVEDDGHAMFK